MEHDVFDKVRDLVEKRRGDDTATSSIRDRSGKVRPASFDAKLCRLYRDLLRHGSTATVAVKYHQLQQVF